jgi:hypothetical protein
MALGVDVAMFYVNWANLQKAADAGALAGAMYLPSNTKAAEAAAADYAQRNGASRDEIVEISVAGDNESVLVVLERSVSYFFGRVLGGDDALIRVRARAGIANVERAGGVIPIGIGAGTNLTPGERITLKGGRIGPGNWAPLALGRDGAKTYQWNIENGYPGELAIGDVVATEPGNMVGPTRAGFDARISAGMEFDSSASPSSYELGDPRVVTVPIIDYAGVQGKDHLEVIGFAEVWIDGVTGKGEVTIYPLRQVAYASQPGSDAPDFGAYSPRLLE